MACKDGALYVRPRAATTPGSSGSTRRPASGTILIDKFPDGGWHEPGGPGHRPAGRPALLRPGVGRRSTASVDPEGFTVDIAKHPEAHDIPGQDVTLTGNNVWSRDPTRSVPLLRRDRPLQALRRPVPRRARSSRARSSAAPAVWRSKLDGSDVELLAWGIRNPFGLAFDEQGELYVSDNDIEEKGDRAVGEDPDRIWHIKNARSPTGRSNTPDWYGFPDIAGDGLPVWDEKHQPEPRPAREAASSRTRRPGPGRPPS